MKRAIVTPAPLPGAALEELRNWLGIRSAAEDPALQRLLRAATDMCEAFTGTMPLSATCEEILCASGEWQKLATRPVQAIVGVDALPAEGARRPLASTDYAVELDAEGGGLIRILRQGDAGRVAVRFVAGLAPDWSSLPEALAHGILRLAAHDYRARDALGDTPTGTPPLAVAALWRPWRRLRLA
ncbi:head-tail connector protein [Pseudopontixanthobacter vadosimaris]|uniref:head-tail connector protein n=1 Tax=Pseudopontixanthobacter vadosimaris TaxID=2726450 RepID=UPI0014753CCE|nr:hypothetical protein [Pseudopontixanthobacter vadosimaris]